MVDLVKYFSGDQIKEDEVGGACSTYEGKGGVLVGNPECKAPLGRPRRRWEDNIQTYLK